MMVSLIRSRMTCPGLGRSFLHSVWTPNKLRSNWPVRLLTNPPSVPAVTASVKCSSSTSSSDKFIMIYHQPHMRLLRAMSRLKLLQTSITVLLLPPVTLLHLQGSVSLPFVCYSAAVALLAGVMLYTASHFLQRVVGAMYLDQSQRTLKVSHLTFWGRRHDILLPVEDVMTVGDSGDSPGEIILRLRRFSNSHIFYFSTRLGRVVNTQGFQKVFGTFH